MQKKYPVSNKRLDGFLTKEGKKLVKTSITAAVFISSSFIGLNSVSAAHSNDCTTDNLASTVYGGNENCGLSVCENVKCGTKGNLTAGHASGLINGHFSSTSNMVSGTLPSIGHSSHGSHASHGSHGSAARGGHSSHSNGAY